MIVYKNRREFLRAVGCAGAALYGAGAAGLTPVARAQPPSEGLGETRLGDGLVRIAGAGGNVLALGNAEGLALVDSGSSGRARALADRLAEQFGGAPVRMLFNTHWHLDHTGGNETVRNENTRIIAHENTRLWMTIGFYVDWEDRTYEARAPSALPNDTFYSSDPQPIEVDFGGERIVYGHLPEAHTDGDIYVFLPERNVIAAGGTVTVGRYPIIDYITGGWIGGLADATRKLIEMADDETLIVPGSGPPQRRAHLEAQVEMLTTIRERIEELAVQGKGADEMFAAGITKDFDERWGNNGELFISNVYEGLWWGGRMRGIVA